MYTVWRTRGGGSICFAVFQRLPWPERHSLWIHPNTETFLVPAVDAGVEGIVQAATSATIFRLSLAFLKFPQIDRQGCPAEKRSARKAGNTWGNVKQNVRNLLSLPSSPPPPRSTPPTWSRTCTYIYTYKCYEGDNMSFFVQGWLQSFMEVDIIE